MANIPVGGQLVLNKSIANIDARFGPYSSIQSAYNAVVDTCDEIISGLHFGIIQSDGSIKEYAWTLTGGTASDYKEVGEGGESSVTVVDSLNSTSSTAALSAKQGKVLSEQLATKLSSPIQISDVAGLQNALNNAGGSGSGGTGEGVTEVEVVDTNEMFSGEEYLAPTITDGKLTLNTTNLSNLIQYTGTMAQQVVKGSSRDGDNNIYFREAIHDDDTGVTSLPEEDDWVRLAKAEDLNNVITDTNLASKMSNLGFSKTNAGSITVKTGGYTSNSMTGTTVIGSPINVEGNNVTYIGKGSTIFANDITVIGTLGNEVNDSNKFNTIIGTGGGFATNWKSGENSNNLLGLFTLGDGGSGSSSNSIIAIVKDTSLTTNNYKYYFKGLGWDGNSPVTSTGQKDLKTYIEDLVSTAVEEALSE